MFLFLYEFVRMRRLCFLFGNTMIMVVNGCDKKYEFKYNSRWWVFWEKVNIISCFVNRNYWWWIFLIFCDSKRDCKDTKYTKIKCACVCVCDSSKSSLTTEGTTNCYAYNRRFFLAIDFFKIKTSSEYIITILKS